MAWSTLEAYCEVRLGDATGQVISDLLVSRVGGVSKATVSTTGQPLSDPLDVLEYGDTC